MTFVSFTSCCEDSGEVPKTSHPSRHGDAAATCCDHAKTRSALALWHKAGPLSEAKGIRFCGEVRCVTSIEDIAEVTTQQLAQLFEAAVYRVMLFKHGQCCSKTMQSWVWSPLDWGTSD